MEEPLYFPLPQTKLEEFQMEPILSRFTELPMLSLGYHSLLSRAREKLVVIADIPGNGEIVSMVHPYRIEGEEDPHVLEMIEVFGKLKKNLFKLQKTSVLLIGDETRVAKAVPRSTQLKTLPGTAKAVITKLKKVTKAPDIVIVTAFDDPVTALTIALMARAPRICVRLTDYPLTGTVLRLLAIMSSLYESTVMVRPLVSPLFQNRSTLFVAAWDPRNKWVDLGPLAEKISMTADKYRIIDAFPDMEVPEAYSAAVRQANQTMIRRDILAINELYTFIKKKDYYGTDMQRFKTRQKEWSEMWKKEFVTDH